MNFVVFRKMCFSTLLNPACWGCAVFDHQVIGGWIAVFLFYLIGWETIAAWISVFVVLFMVHLIIYPAFEYSLQFQDKILRIFIFQADFKRRNLSEMRRKKAVVKIIALYTDGQTEVIWSGREVFGCDVRFINSGFFLFKHIFSSWSVICNGYEYGTELGNRVTDLVFVDKTSPDLSTLRFLFRSSFISLDVNSYDIYSTFTYFHPVAVYKPLSCDEPIKLAILGKFRYFLCTIGSKNYLIGYHLNKDNIPMAYIIITPTIIWKNDGLDITLNTDENGAFQLPKH